MIDVTKPIYIAAKAQGGSNAIIGVSNDRAKMSFLVDFSPGLTLLVAVPAEQLPAKAGSAPDLIEQIATSLDEQGHYIAASCVRQLGVEEA